MDQLLKEIQDDLRQERYLSLWNQYRHYIWAFIIAVILGTSTYSAWTHYQKKQHQAQGDALFLAYQAYQQNKWDDANLQLEQLKQHSDTSYQGLSTLYQANILLQQHKKTEAIENYQQLYQNKSTAPELRLLAGLLQLYHDTNMPEKTKQDYLKALEANNSPWRFAAQEYRILDSVQKGDKAKALTQLTQLISNNEAPTSMKQRATQLQQSLPSISQ